MEGIRNLGPGFLGLCYPFKVGDIVTYYSNFKTRFLVKSMVLNAKEASGYSVIVVACTGTEDLIGDWYGACGFYPARVAVDAYAPVTLSVNTKNAKVIDHYPHKCPKCKGKAFIGFKFIDCMYGCFGRG